MKIRKIEEVENEVEKIKDPKIYIDGNNKNEKLNLKSEIIELEKDIEKNKEDSEKLGKYLETKKYKWFL